MSKPRKAALAASGAGEPRSLFQRLAGRRGLVLAVSGGADSTALMVLAAHWPERPPLLVVTVDHGLRAESTAEAQRVAENAERLGLPWRIAKAPPRPPAGNLQDWARRVRYRLLAEAARAAGFDTIVTAHHRDDQAETFLLRLARGSGVYGLAAMAEESIAERITLARPLLRVSRDRLAEIAAASGLPTIDDPSNADLKFDRVRMRALMPRLAEEGLTAERLAATAAQLRRAATALDHYASELLRVHFAADAYGVVSGKTHALVDAPEEVALRALALMLRAVGGADYTPALEGVEALRQAVVGAQAEETVARTLHGVAVTTEQGHLTARREWGRTGLPALPAHAGSTLVWDGRFRVDIPSLPGDLRIAALGSAAAPLHAASGDRAAVRALPGLFRNGTLVAAPAGISAAAPLQALAAECLVGQRLMAAARPEAAVSG